VLLEQLVEKFDHHSDRLPGAGQRSVAGEDEAREALACLKGGVGKGSEVSVVVCHDDSPLVLPW
jgi:hypothetical protein